MTAGAATAMTGACRCGAAAGVARHRAAGAGSDGGGENGKFLDQFLRAALRARGLAFPFGGADELFEILRTFGTMKFVKWHGVILPVFHGLSSSSCVALLG